MTHARVGVSHKDGPAIYVFKITLEPGVTLRLDRRAAALIADALVHGGVSEGEDIRGLSWSIDGRHRITVTDLRDYERRDRWGNYHEPQISIYTLTNDWGPDSWQLLAVKLVAFSGHPIITGGPG
jgi:hypothetical protein